MPRWFCCLISIWLLAACQPGAPTSTAIPTQPPPSATPLATRTPFVMPTDRPSQTPVPVTPSATPIKVDTFTGLVVQPPLTIKLPKDWTTLYDTALVNELGELNYVPIAVYKGPVTGGTGTIALVWNFSSIASANPFDSNYGQINLLSDGERLLRQLVIEIGCNVGLEPARTDLTLGGLPAEGRFWSAVTCPADMPDTRGWYVARQDMQIGFVFYAFTDPITAMSGPAQQELQAILDTVVLRVKDVPTATPGVATPYDEALTATQASTASAQATSTPPAAGTSALENIGTPTATPVASSLQAIQTLAATVTPQ